MKTQNTVQLIGYLGQNPVTKTAVNGSRLARLSLATDYYRKNQSGEVIRKVSWHNIMVWDKLADCIDSNFISGSHVLIVGEIRYRSYINKRGEHKNTAEIKAHKVLNLDR